MWKIILWARSCVLQEAPCIFGGPKVCAKIKGDQLRAVQVHSNPADITLCIFMPHIPKINRRELQKSGLFTEDRFYQLLSERCNFIDRQTARSFYHELVRLIVSELRTHKVVRLPMLGDFALIKQKPKSALVGKVRMMIGEISILKFYPKDTLRQYFNKFNGL